MLVSMTYPIMVSINILPLDENSVILKCRDKANLEVLIPSQRDASKDKAEMWTKEIMPFMDCGDEAADWITEVIKGDKNVEVKLRLGYWAEPEGWQDGIDQRYKERGAFQNYTSYMLMTTSSLKELSSRLPEHPLTFKQFRPNLLVDTNIEPFSEDNWTWVRIGEETIFRKIKDCSRCSQVNIDPETCKFNSKHEPLSTLNKYRKKKKKSGPIMGICMGLYRAGNIKVGDPVYIAV